MAHRVSHGIILHAVLLFHIIEEDIHMGLHIYGGFRIPGVTGICLKVSDQHGDDHIRGIYRYV